MKLTAITATYQRPEAMRLCERYLKRQTRQPDQWLVLDGPEPMRLKVLAAIEGGRVEGDAVAFVEDDDHYRADYLAWVEERIGRGYDIVGEGMAVYYNVNHRWWSECRNVRHAALCQTSVHASMLENVASVIKAFDSPFFDTRVWRLEGNPFLHLPRHPGERRVIGIKGQFGDGAQQGYSGEHRDANPPGTHADPSMIQLWRWVGDDAAEYSRFQTK